MTRSLSPSRPPGDLMIWVLIVSELAVFCAGVLAFLAVRVSDPAGFAAAQAHLDGMAAGVNTVLLVSSGLLAALAVRPGTARWRQRGLLWGAAGLGGGFLWLKGAEYADKAARGIDTDTHPFFMFYYLLTGFHAAHVAAGIVVLGLVSWRCQRAAMEDGVAFWHMVDLVWVLLYPALYLLR